MNNVSGCFQLQPQFGDRDAWSALAERENLYFEALELSGPPVLNENGRHDSVLEWYAACQNLANTFEWYAMCGRLTSVHGCYIDANPGSGDNLFRELSMRRLHESCRFAKAFGAKNIVFHSSCEPFLRGSYMDYWAGRSAEGYEKLADQYDLNIFVENSMDVDPGPIKELMRRVTNPRIGVCLDIGHANYSRTPMEQWFYELGEKIGYMHLSDNYGLYDDHIPLGEGTVDFEKASRLWRTLDRAIPITLETGSVEDTIRSIDYLKEHHYFGF